MDNSQQLKEAFSKSLELDIKDITDDLAYSVNKQWDSIRHMNLVAEIEDLFDIMMDTEDIIDMSSFAKTKEILGKYDVKFDT
ncbi:MAG: acyl carrier protein [SAR324 cluster bacterium]|nr:acyl carrier protein [SAR324 cluster bacterium]